MPDEASQREPEVTPVNPLEPEGPQGAAPPEAGGDDPTDAEVDLGEQARRDAERDRELREKYGDQEY